MSRPTVRSTLVPRLALSEWIAFSVIAALLAATGIYTTLLTGWADTGSIVAVLASVAVFGLFRRRASVYQLNLGQTMASAGGSIGFVAACYASLYIVDKEWSPNPWALMAMFAGAGVLGTLVGAAVRKQMVRYYFPSGTACAVIQRAVTADEETTESQRPVWLLKLWGAIAMAITIPTKISTTVGGGALLGKLAVALPFPRLPSLPIGTDPLLYGIGLVVGPRVGLGMIIGALLPSLWIVPMLATEDGSAHAFGLPVDWARWMAISVLTLPTFAAIGFAYLYRTTVATPPGFTAGATDYLAPPTRKVLQIALGVVALGLVAVVADIVFGLPWFATLATIAVAVPLSVVNGRVTGDTDINPVRLVAIVLISAFFWLVEKDVARLLGMAVVGATVASVAVDLMQDMRTGHLLDQDSGHQSFVQVLGVCIGAIVAVPILILLIDRFGVGEDTALTAPGAQLWAETARALSGGVHFSTQLVIGIVIANVLGLLYAWLTVWPRSARYMPSLFGVGIGLLLPLQYATSILIGGLLKSAVTHFYARGRSGDEQAAAKLRAGDDTMVVGASVFAAAALLAIGLVLLDVVFSAIGWHPWYLAS